MRTIKHYIIGIEYQNKGVILVIKKSGHPRPSRLQPLPYFKYDELKDDNNRCFICTAYEWYYGLPFNGPGSGLSPELEAKGVKWPLADKHKKYKQLPEFKKHRFQLIVEEE